MGNLWIPLDDETHDAFKRKHPRKMKDIIIEWIKADLGQDPATVDSKLKHTQDQIDELYKQLQALADKKEEEQERRIRICKERQIKSLVQVKQPHWKGNFNCHRELEDDGITWDFLYQHWEEI